MTTPARCPGAARLRSRWTARALAGAFLDLALAWAFLCLAALASFADRLLPSFLGLPLPCTCARPHLPCILSFLARYPARALRHVHAALGSRFPFLDDDQDHSHPQRPRQLRDQEDDEDGEAAAAAARTDEGPRPSEEEQADLQRELEKERSAAASAAEEAMAMILCLQKEKSALEIDERQQRRAAEERTAFYEDELDELRDILLVREREASALRKEVAAYRRLIGLAPEDQDDDEEEVMVTPRSALPPDSQPSSSRSVGVQLGNESGFSFQSPFLRQDPVTPVRDDVSKKRIDNNDDRVAVQTPNNAVPVVGSSKQEVHSFEDDGAETVEILPFSARSLDFDPAVNFHVDDSTTDAEEHTADEFQKVACGGMDKNSHDHSGSENDSSIFDVHVVDDICLSKEVKGLIGRSFSEATMQIEKLQTRAAADDLLVKSLNAVKGSQDKIKLAASQRRESMQLQLLEDIASQLQGIKDAADAERHLYSVSLKSSKKK